MIGSYDCIKIEQANRRPNMIGQHAQYQNKPCELGFQRDKDKCVGKALNTELGMMDQINTINF